MCVLFRRCITRALVPVLAGLSLAAISVPVRADSAALRFSTGTQGISTTFQVLGWQFQTHAPISVDGLGYFDFAADGLNGSHDVGIWNSSGSLLASATVDTSDSIVGPPAVDGAFRYEPITPLLLPAGQTFTIGGTAFVPNGLDLWEKDLAPLASDPSISILSPSSVFANPATNTLVEPTTTDDTNAFAGPNFLISTGPSPVPEPGSLALLLTGMLPLAGSLRRRRCG